MHGFKTECVTLEVGDSMRTDVRSTLIKSLSAVIACGLLVFAFQNCGKAGFDQALDDGDNLASSSQDTSAPFAFNSTFDQITYSSCFGTGLTGNSAYFTLKAGAYDGGGVNMTSTFLSYMNSTLKPQYPSTTVTVEQMKAYVGDTVENNTATLQMALRTRGAPQQVRNPTGSSPALNTDYVNLMTDLTDDRIMEPIFRALGGVVNYFPLAATTAQSMMEASITYNGDEGVAYSLRNDLTNNGMLALTYTAQSGASAFAARVPAGATTTDSSGNSTTDNTVAYGRGYTLGFAPDIAYYTKLLHPELGAPASNTARPNSRNPNNIMVTVSEVDLANPTVNAGSWTCDSNRRYLIVRAADAAACPADDVSRMGDAAYRKELQIIRRHLAAAQWDVSVDRRCVVPKSGSCYTNASGTEETVEYDQTNECYQGIQGLANPAITKRCAQYFSICTRN